MTDRMPAQMWAFLGSLVSVLCAVFALLLGEPKWALSLLVVAVAAGVAARVASLRAPAPMPYWIRWVLFLPRTFQSAARLRTMLQPHAGERVLEIGPGVGIHALPIGAAVAPGGALHALDIQPDMLRELRRRATTAGIDNLAVAVGDAQRLPYGDRSFDAAYLISVLGEIPDQQAALRELRRVLKPHGRLVIGEIVVDPDFIGLAALLPPTAATGFVFERRSGPGLAYLASFRLSEKVPT